MNLQEYIEKKKAAKAAKKADKKAKVEFFNGSNSTELWNRIQEKEPEFADIIRYKGLDTIRANRGQEEVAELDFFMELVHKSSIILGFDLTECSFFGEYDCIEDESEDVINIPDWINLIFDSNYKYYKHSQQSKLVADFTDVCTHEYRAYDEDHFVGSICYNKELGAGMIFFSLEDDVNDDQVNFIRTR